MAQLVAQGVHVEDVTSQRDKYERAAELAAISGPGSSGGEGEGEGASASDEDDVGLGEEVQRLKEELDVTKKRMQCKDQLYATLKRESVDADCVVRRTTNACSLGCLS